MPMRRISTSLPTVGFADDPSPLSEGLANAAATFGQLWPRLAQIEADKADRETARAERRADRQEARDDRQKLWTDRAGERETDRADRQMHNDALTHERDEDRKVRATEKADADARALAASGVDPGGNTLWSKVATDTRQRHQDSSDMELAKAGAYAGPRADFAQISHQVGEQQKQRGADAPGALLAREKFAREQAIQELGDPDHDLVEQAIVDATGTKRMASYRRPLDAAGRAARVQAINRRVDVLMGRAQEAAPEAPHADPVPPSVPAPRQPAGTGYTDPQVGVLWNKGIPSDRDWNASNREPAPVSAQGPALWTAPGAVAGRPNQQTATVAPTASARQPTPANVQTTGGSGQEQASKQFMAGAGGWGMLAPPNMAGGAQPAATNALTSLHPDAQAILTGSDQQARDTAIMAIRDPAQRLAIIQALRASGHR